MTRNVRGSGEEQDKCEKNMWNMRGSGEDQDKMGKEQKSGGM